MKTFSNPEWLAFPGEVRLHAEMLLEVGDRDRPVRSCPFCGSQHMTIFNAFTPCFQVDCNNCTAQVTGAAVYARSNEGRYQTRKAALAGYRRAFKSAINAWNRRPSGSIRIA